MYSRIIKLISEYLSSAQVFEVLNIGCGRSEIARKIALNFDCKSIDLIDHDEEVLNFQKENLKGINIRKNFYKVELTNEDMVSLLKKKYNIIILTEVLEHVTTDRKLLRQVYQLLSDDGICLFSIPSKFSDKIMIFLNPHYMTTKDGERRHVNFYSLNDIQSLLKEAGFKRDRFEKFNSGYFFFHLILNLFRIPVDEDTGEIYYRGIWDKIAIKLGSILMSIVNKSRLNVILDKVSPRNYFGVLCK